MYMYVHPGCKMTAPDPTMPDGMKAMLADLNALYRSQPALHQMDLDYDGFDWIQLMAYEENVLAFTRKTEKPEETLLVVCNFAAVPYSNYPVVVPFAGKYKEIFNSDKASYGGENRINARAKTAALSECDERAYSIKLRLPALGITILTCTPDLPEKKTVRKPAVRKKAEKKEK